MREIHPGPGYAVLYEAYGLDPAPGGYGLLLMREKGGEGRRTLVSPDVELCRMVADAIRPGFLPGEVIELATGGFTAVPGWVVHAG
ncbi:hypothetical protein [Streptomyces sp. NPDC047974]|uniref:hypothetical protein n=1 Tax=Streptomyces sp. NPDC047974 TaxID=3154343 RepID=UPI0033E63379